MSDRDNITLPRELAEKALEALEHFKLVFGGYSEEVKALRAALAAEQPVAKAWAEGYQQGVKDERTSEASIGIAGFGAKVEPARQNPYGTALAAEQPKPEPVAVVGTQSNEIWKRVYENWVRMPLPEPAKKVHLLRDLPLGTLLYPAPPENESLRRDADRWRHWRDSHGFATIDHEGGRCFVTLICDCDDPDQVRAKRFKGEDSFEWLDAFTDAAMEGDKT